MTRKENFDLISAQSRDKKNACNFFFELSYPSILKCVSGAQKKVSLLRKNRLIDTLPFSTHNISLG